MPVLIFVPKIWGELFYKLFGQRFCILNPYLGLANTWILNPELNSKFGINILRS